MDGWILRDRYIELILDRSEENVQSFVKKYITKPLNEEERIRLLKLLEMQYNSLLMYTSCGWFFSDISGIETIQILKYGSDPLQTYLPDSDIDITIIVNSKFIKSNSTVDLKN